jgi:hypothetical protein
VEPSDKSRVQKVILERDLWFDLLYALAGEEALQEAIK